MTHLDRPAETRMLQWVLAINFTMFLVEGFLGWWGESTGLLADALDMLADALVYGAALLAVGGAVHRQQRAARMSGFIQLTLGLGVLAEVIRRAVLGSEPVSLVMIATAAVALAANLTCVFLLRRHRDGGVHLQASWIFTTTDAQANLGVMVAGLLVLWTGSALPDLLIGTAIAALVLRGALRILRLRPESPSTQ